MMCVDDFKPSRFLDSERGFMPALSREEFENRRRVFTDRALATLNTGDIEHASDFTVGAAAPKTGEKEYSGSSPAKWKSVAVCALLAGGVSAGVALYGASAFKQAPSSQPSVSSLELNTLSVPTADSLSGLRNESPVPLKPSEVSTSVMGSASVGSQAASQTVGEFKAKSSCTPKQGTASRRVHAKPTGSPVTSTPSSVDSNPVHATVAAQRPLSLFSGHSPSSASLTSPGPSPHAFITRIAESLSTSNQFTALWILVAALALTLESCAGLVRALRWLGSENGRDSCSSAWRCLFPEKPESAEAMLCMRARLDTLEQQLRERAGMMDAQKGTIKLIEGELQRSMDAENTLRRDNRKLKKELQKGASASPRGTPVQAPQSPPRDPVTAVLHTTVEASNIKSPNFTPKPRSSPSTSSRSPSTRATSLAPPVPTPPLPTPPGPSPPRPGPRPPVPPTSFSPQGRNISRPGSASTRSRTGNDRERFHNASAALVGVVGRAMSNASTCTNSCIGVALNIPPDGSPVSDKSFENPLL